MVPTGPKMVTSRFDVADGYTIEGYERTGGYDALRKALGGMKPEEVHAEVKSAELLGRGGAGFPAGVKWGFCPPGVLPRYVVVNGDESEPGTYKDRLLMELDPHQLIEGVVLTLLRHRRGAGLPVRAGRDGPRPGADRAGPERRLRQGLRGQGHPRQRVQRRHHAGLGGRRLHRRRGDRPHREPRGRAGDAPAEAALLPGRQGPVHAADDREQRRDAVERPVDRDQRRRRLQADRGGHLHRHADVRGVGPREPAGRLRGAPGRHHLPPAVRGSRVLRRHPGRRTSSRPSSPAAPRRRGSSRSTSTCPSTSRRSTRRARCWGRVPSSSWTRPPTW